MKKEFNVFCCFPARLPFKRLNQVPKETGKPKRTRTASSAPSTVEPSASDGENEVDATSAPLQPRPALINGRGPLDGFMRRTKCSVSSASAVIDLTEDSNSTDVKIPLSAPVDALCPSTGEAAKNTQNVTETEEPEVASAVPLSSEETMETDEAEDSVAFSQLDSTVESETDTEQIAVTKQSQDTEENQENESLLSTSSVSLVESSPEPSKCTSTTSPSVSTQSICISELCISQLPFYSV